MYVYKRKEEDREGGTKMNRGRVDHRGAGKRAHEQTWGSLGASHSPPVFKRGLIEKAMGSRAFGHPALST